MHKLSTTQRRYLSLTIEHCGLETSSPSLLRTMNALAERGLVTAAQGAKHTARRYTATDAGVDACTAQPAADPYAQMTTGKMEMTPSY